MKKCIFFILAFQWCLHTSFAQDKTKEIADKLIGAWIWDYTQICQRSNPPNRTPKSEGYTEKLDFKSGKMNLLRNDSVLYGSKYEIIKIDDTLNGVYYLFKSDIYHGIIAIENDNLSISTCPNDGSHRVFYRKKNNNHQQ